MAGELTQFGKSVTRRRAMRLLGGGAAVMLSGCSTGEDEPVRTLNGLDDATRQRLIDRASLLETATPTATPTPTATYVPPAPVGTLDELQARLKETGLASVRIDDLIDLSLPAAGLVRPGERPATIPGGLSQVGGLPHLEPADPWPRAHGVNLSLVTQLDLDALASVEIQGLPDHGVLQLFMALRDGCYLEAELFNFGEFETNLVWHPDASALQRRNDGTAKWGAEPIALELLPFLSIPVSYSTALDHWSEEDRDLLGRYDSGVHCDWVGGWSDEFQNDPRWMAARRDVDEGRTAATDPGRWQLIFQHCLTPGDHMWADGGDVRCVARIDDLANQDFSSVVLDVTSH